MVFYKFKKTKYILLCFLLIFFSSCSGIKIPNVNRNVEEYKKSEAMIFVSQLKNEYEATFGSEIWDLTSGDGKTRYESYVVSNVKKYLEVIKTLNLYFSNEIENSSKVITSTINSQIMRAAQEYLDSLSQGDRNYIGCSLEDVLKMYTEYYKACYVIEYALRNEDDEISVSESKVIRVDQIVMSDRDRAYSVREELNQRGANFAYFARQYSESDVVSLKIERGDELSGMFPEAFLLDNGEMSDVIEFNKKYYIFKCTDAYDVYETEKRKEYIKKAIRSKAFADFYYEYADQNVIVLKDPYWQEITLKGHPETTTSNFFEIFSKYFGEELDLL